MGEFSIIYGCNQYSVKGILMDWQGVGCPGVSSRIELPDKVLEKRQLITLHDSSI